jgi:hypothetical protein
VQDIIDRTYTDVVPFAYQLANAAEFHICSTKSMIVNYRKYCHLQGKVLRGLMWNAWFTWFTMYRDIQVRAAAVSTLVLVLVELA